MTTNSMNISDLMKESRDYWHRQLSEPISPVSLYTDYPRSQASQAEMVQLEFDKDVYLQIQSICKGNDALLFTFFLTMLKLLLIKHTDQTDITVVCPAEGEQRSQSLLFLRDELRQEMTCREALLQIRETVAQGFRHQAYPYRRILDMIPEETRDALFRIALSMGRGNQENKSETLIRESGNEIHFHVQHTEASLLVTLFYNNKLFSRDTMERICNQYEWITKQCVAKMSIQLQDVVLADELERQRVLFHFNNTRKAYPEEKTVHGLFEEQTAEHPERVALIYDEHSLTYRELNDRANRLAAGLSHQGIGRESRVGLCVWNPVELAVSIFAVLKAGGCYVILPPAYPRERLQYMIENSEPAVIITDQAEHEFPERCCCLDLTGKWDEGRSFSPSASPATASDAAYVIYTSGTTGKPKGVVVEHRNIVNTLLCRMEEYPCRERTVFLQLFSAAFDGFVASFFTPLLAGAPLVLLDEETVKDLGKIREVIRKHNVTHFITVPSLFSILVEEMSEHELKTLSTVTLAGDQIPETLMMKVKSKNPELEIVHEYGVSEAAVMATLYHHQENDPVMKIGKPTTNTRVYIMNQWSQPQPVGVPGEMYIAGSGVARGYLHADQISMDKFMEDLYVPESGRMYRTGDKGRWLPDGTIQFLGRLDHQVKIRGFRIELEEITSILRQHAEIEDTVIRITQDGEEDKQLCAYLKCSSPLSVSEIRTFLADRIPAYMIPAYFICMEQFPYTVNGKIDYRRLPKPPSSIYTGESFEGARDDIESRLIKIWENVLGVQGISINDDYSALGGHSLKAVLIISKIYTEFQVKLDVIEFLSRNTVKKLREWF